MSEEAESDAWYALRLSPMMAFGWDEREVTGFLLQDNHRINERLEWLERALETANRSKERLERLTSWWPLPEETVAAVNDLLNQPLAAMEAGPILDQSTERVFSWEGPLERAKIRWEQEGAVEEWTKVYQTLRTMDSSSLGAIALFQPLFDMPERRTELWDRVDAVRQDEQRQRELMGKAADSLRTEGFDVPSLVDRPLMEALVVLEDWQSLFHDVEAAALNARQLIAPFDGAASQRWASEIRQVVHIDERHRLTDISKAVKDVGQQLENRRQDLSETLNIWRRKGMVFSISGAIKPAELHEWEGKMEHVTATVERHLRLTERVDRFRRAWPVKTESLVPLLGHLDQTEELGDAVEALEQEWTTLELDGLALVEPYLQRGMEMDVWKSRILDDPKATLTTMQHRQRHWDRQLKIVERYEGLDVSIEGFEDQQHRLELLRQTSIEPEVVDELEGYVERKERREWRHRTMLEDALGKLRIAYGHLEEINTKSMNLAAFEAHLAQLERSGGTVTARPLAERAKKGLKRELEQLEAEGWNTSAWASMMVTRPDEVALQLNRVRPHVRSIDRLRARIMALPWGRDVRLALDVQFRIQQPEELERLADSVPTWLAHLAQRPVEDADFNLHLWRPKSLASSTVSTNDIEASIPRSVPSASHDGMIVESVDVKTKEIGIEKPNVHENSVAVPTHPHTDVSDKPEEPVKKPTTRPREAVEEVGDQPPAPGESISAVEQREGAIEIGADEGAPVEAQISEDVSVDSRLKNTDQTSQLDNESASPNDTKRALEALEAVMVALDLQDMAAAIGSRGLEAVNYVRREMARHVNQTPRDVRVARLLRLVLRLLPEGTKDDAEKGQLLSRLAEGIPTLKRWTRRRLEARHQGSSGKVLDDALALGKALERIPGLGRPVPLGKDTWPLPMDLNGLRREVDTWTKAASPAAAGGVRN